MGKQLTGSRGTQFIVITSMIVDMTGQADCPHRSLFPAEGFHVCRICGKRVAPIGYTKIVDSSGTRWVKHEPRKRRKPGRALRFAEIKVGDELVCVHEAYVPSRDRFVVTDLWFDPVAGERDETAGQMVAIRWMRDGQPVGTKRPHTRRGLAMQGYHYAKDYLSKRAETERSVADAIDAIRLQSTRTA